MAIRGGNLQLVTEALHDTLAGDVGDARAEHTRLTGELLVNDVADLVRHRAQMITGHDITVAGELLFLIDVVQAKLDLPTALRQRLDVADDQRLGLDNAPVLVHDLSVLGRARNATLLVDARQSAPSPHRR